MHFRQAVWQVVIKIVIKKNLHCGEKKIINPQQQQQQLILLQYLLSAILSTCLATATLFFHSRVQLVQDIMPLLLICLSPHSNAIVRSRAVDVCCSGRITPVPLWWSTSTVYKSISMSYLYEADHPANSFFFVWAQCLRCEKVMDKSHGDIQPFLLMFRNLKSFCTRNLYSIYTAVSLSVLIVRSISKLRSAQLLRTVRSYLMEKIDWHLPTSVCQNSRLFCRTRSTRWPSSRRTFSSFSQ